MKLYLVMYALGQLIGSLGPIPDDDLPQCQNFAQIFWNDLDIERLAYQDFKKNDIEYRCEYFANRPEH